MKVWISLFKTIFFALLMLIFMEHVKGQEISIQMNTSQMPANQIFQITAQVKNGRIKSIGEFPEIKGLVKRGRQRGSMQEIVNGKSTFYDKLSQNYVAERVGVINIPKFTMEINGKRVSFPARKLQVTKPQQQQRRQYYDIFDQMMGNNGASNEKLEFTDIKADAFIDLSVDKNEVYVGEGFTTTLTFYVSASNRAELDYYELNDQITSIRKELSPPNAWEEAFNIHEVKREPVNINGKRYYRSVLLKSTFFPWNDKEIVLPSLNWKMLKYDRPSNRSFYFGPNKQSVVNFNTKTQHIKVKQLPPHPLRDKVQVGQYQLKEKIDKTSGNTGESFEYVATIFGRGNISTLNKFEVKESENFDFYPPTLKQSIEHVNNTIRGSATFRYFFIPNEPGHYDFKDYFQWIYFDPKREVYDTLRSDIKLKITGESKQNKEISSNDLGGFYDSINERKNKLVSVTKENNLSFIVNIFIGLLLLFTTFLFIRK